MINSYHSFLPGIAKCLATLTEATKSRGKVITWTAECQASFMAAKPTLALATLLNHPDPNSKTRLSTDASDSAIITETSWYKETNCILFQKVDINTEPVLYV